MLLNPGPWDQRNASHRTTGLKSARTPRNRGHHAGDATDSSRHASRPVRLSSPTVTPLGVHMVIQSIAQQMSRRQRENLASLLELLIKGLDENPAG